MSIRGGGGRPFCIVCGNVDRFYGAQAGRREPHISLLPAHVVFVGSLTSIACAMLSRQHSFPIVHERPASPLDLVGSWYRRLIEPGCDPGSLDAMRVDALMRAASLLDERNESLRLSIDMLCNASACPTARGHSGGSRQVIYSLCTSYTTFVFSWTHSNSRNPLVKARSGMEVHHR